MIADLRFWACNFLCPRVMRLVGSLCPWKFMIVTGRAEHVYLLVKLPLSSLLCPRDESGCLRPWKFMIVTGLVENVYLLVKLLLPSLSKRDESGCLRPWKFTIVTGLVENVCLCLSVCLLNFLSPPLSVREWRNEFLSVHGNSCQWWKMSVSVCLFVC